MTWFRVAVQRGDLAGAMAEVDALRPLGLGPALGLAVLLAEARDPRADRAAARWLARLALERPGVGTAQLRVGLRAFDAVTTDRVGGRAQLAQLAAAHGVEGVEMLLRRAERHGRPTDGEGPSG